MDETILNQEEFTLKEYIKVENSKKYILLEDAKYVFNINVRRSNDGKNLAFETIKYLEKSIAPYLNQEGLSLTDNYQNRRAIVDNYLVVLNAENKYGIYGFDTNTGAFKNEIALQYDDLRYSQNNKNIYVAKKETIGKEQIYNIGITNIIDKKQIIKLDRYEKIEIYLGEKGIYKVAKNKKYGLINNEGKVLISEEQDEIGMSVDDFDSEDQGKLLFDKFIPVLKGGKWGIYVLQNDKSIRIVEPVLEALGYEKYRYVDRDSSGYIMFTNEDKKFLEKKKENPDKYDGKTLTEEELNEIGFTTDKSKIVNGENVLTIPDEEGYRRYSYKSKYWKIWYIIIRTCNA